MMSYRSHTNTRTKRMLLFTLKEIHESSIPEQGLILREIMDSEASKRYATNRVEHKGEPKKPQVQNLQNRAVFFSMVIKVVNNLSNTHLYP